MARASTLHCSLLFGRWASGPAGGRAWIRAGRSSPQSADRGAGSQRGTRGDQGGEGSKMGLWTKVCNGPVLGAPDQTPARLTGAPRSSQPDPMPPNTRAHKPYILQGPWLDSLISNRKDRKREKGRREGESKRQRESICGVMSLKLEWWGGGASCPVGRRRFQT